MIVLFVSSLVSVLRVCDSQASVKFGRKVMQLRNKTGENARLKVVKATQKYRRR